MTNSLKKLTNWEIETPYGWKSFEGVVKKSIDSKLVRIKFTDGSGLNCSEGHGIFTFEGDITFAKDIKIGDIISGKNGPLIVKSIEITGESTEFYDLYKVDNFRRCYYTENIASHNTDFLGSSNTLISSSCLKDLTARIENPIKFIAEGEEGRNGLRIYKQPESKHIYFISVDTSRGVGLDYSAYVVFDITDYPHQVVATFRHDKVDSMNYPNYVFSTAKLYNDASILIETNEVGKQVADILHHELEYDNVLWTITKGRSGQILTGGGGKIGVYMSSATKRIGCSNLKTIVENNKLIICDEDIVEELKCFVLVKDTFRAEEGFHDDLVMCLVSFAWAAQEPYFKDLSSLDIRKELFSQEIDKMKKELGHLYVVDHSDEPKPKYTKLDGDDDLWIEVETNSRFFR